MARPIRSEVPAGTKVKHLATGAIGTVIDRMARVSDVVWIVWDGVEDDAFHDNAEATNINDVCMYEGT